MGRDPIVYFDGPNFYHLTNGQPLTHGDPYGLQHDVPRLSFDDLVDLAMSLETHTALARWYRHTPIFGDQVPDLTVELLYIYLGNKTTHHVALDPSYVRNDEKVLKADLDAAANFVQRMNGLGLFVNNNGQVEPMEFDVVAANGGSFSFGQGDLATALHGLSSYKYTLSHYEFVQAGFVCWYNVTSRVTMSDTYDFDDANGAGVPVDYLDFQPWWWDKAGSFVYDVWMKQLEDEDLAKRFDVSISWDVTVKVMVDCCTKKAR